MKIKTIYIFSDSGHAWAKVKRSELIQLNILDKITSFSYQFKDFVYLEEDCDLTTYLKALKDKNINYKFRTFHSNRSKIRNYENFRKPKVELVKIYRI